MAAGLERRGDHLDGHLPKVFRHGKDCKFPRFFCGDIPRGSRFWLTFRADLACGTHRAHSGIRRFDPGVLEKLALIALGRAAGFTLDEIAPMFATGGRHIDRVMLGAKAEELDGKIRKLGAMRDGLRHAAVCPAPSHLECPTFRRLLRAAASGAIGKARKRAPSKRRRPDLAAARGPK
jgi:hypothetical protein